MERIEAIEALAQDLNGAIERQETKGTQFARAKVSIILIKLEVLCIEETNGKKVKSNGKAY